MIKLGRFVFTFFLKKEVSCFGKKKLFNSNVVGRSSQLNNCLQTHQRTWLLPFNSAFLFSLHMN